MNLRHIYAFITVAEELHFRHAAKRLNVGESPLSRTIRKLEAELGVTLLWRTSHGAGLTPAGQAFLEDARRIMLAVNQAQARAQAAAAGLHGTLRIGLAGDIGRKRLASVLALCREEAPQVSIRLTEVPRAQLVHGLKDHLFDAGFAKIGDGEAGIVASTVWDDPLMVVLPLRHPLLAFKHVAVEEIADYPLVLCDPQQRKDCNRELERLFRAIDLQPVVTEYVASHAMMLTLVAAGYGVGLSSAELLANGPHANVVPRPIADPDAKLTTYLLRVDGEVAEPVRQFIERAERIGREGAGTAQDP